MPGMRSRRLLGAGLAGAVIGACAPAAAHGAQAFVAGPQLVYLAGPAEANQVTVKRVGTTHQITDTGAAIAPGALCGPSGPNRVTCNDHATLGVTAVVVVTGDLDDIARVTSPVTASLNGGAGADDLTGGGGNDLLNAGTGSDDRLDGGAGADQVLATEALGGAVLIGGTGNDVLSGPADGFIESNQRNQFDGGPGRDTLNGSVGRDLLTGGTGPDILSGGAGGSDLVRYDDHAQAVIVTIGAGANDGSATDEGVVDAATVRDDVRADVEAVLGGGGADTITGTADDENLGGGANGDVLNGGGGSDTLCGQGLITSFSFSIARTTDPLVCLGSNAGADTLNGDAGNDLLQGGPGPDVHNGGAGRDLAMWAERTQRVIATINDCAVGPQCSQANDGQEDVSASAGLQPEGDRIALDVESVSTGAGNDSLGGSAAANALFGGPGDDGIAGLGGDDLLCGDVEVETFVFTVPDCPFGGPFAPADPAGADSLDGGGGNDLLEGELGADVLTGGDGLDTVTYEDRNGGVDVTISDTCGTTACALANDGARDADTQTPGPQSEGDLVERDVENLVGGGGGDLLRGDGDPNVLDGGDGNDRLEGLVGRDVLEPGPGDDVVVGGGSFDLASYRSRFSGLETGVTVTLDNVANDGGPDEADDIRTDVEGVIGSRYADQLTGHPNAFGDTLLGYEGDDTLDGRAGNDVLNGGPGADTMLGGEGDDLLAAADGAGDTTVDCGDGTGDTAQHDTALDVPANCETLDPFDTPALAGARW